MNGIRFWAGALAFAFILTLKANAGETVAHPISRFVQSHPEIPTLTLAPGMAVDRVLHGAEVHRYTVRLRAGEFASVHIRQLRGNVVVVAFDPAGKLIDLADRNPSGQVETIEIVAQTDGDYSLQTAIYEWNAPDVHYDIRLKRREPVAATPAGRAGQYVDSWYDSGLPGAAIAVLRGDHVVFQRTIGLADVEQAVPIRPSTRFDLASVSKQFTGLAIAMLVDRGVLALDDDVRRYVPELPDFGKPILIRHLVYHTSGLRDWDICFGLMGRAIENGITTSQIIDFVSRQRELNFPSGSAQEYSNTGYNILAEVVARVTKQSFPAWLRENVLGPAGMSAIANENAFQTIPDSSHSYRTLVPAPAINSSSGTAAAGSSSLHASLNDMIAWARANRSSRPGSPGTRALFGQPGKLDDGSPLEYGFGQWFRERKGIRMVGHLGLAAGFRVLFRRYPDRDLTFIFMTNDGNDGSYLRSEVIENLFLGLDPDPVDVPEGEYSPPATLPLADARGFVGVYYSDELRTAYEIREGDGGLVANHAINGSIPLRPESGDHFGTDRWFMPSVSFVRDSNKAVSGFRVTSDAARNILFRRVGP